MKSELALSVEKNSNAANTSKSNAVPGNAAVCFIPVHAIRPAGTAPVYNMEVEGLHNFAVNGGMIVHNCMDAMRYYVNSLPDWRFE